jgi:hypothetical protein
MRLVVLYVILALAACKGDAQRCEQAARNFATLTFWKKAEVEIAQAPADRRATMRKKKLAQFTNEMETRIELVVRQCQSANNTDQIDCMIEAKTAEEALECADLAPDE